MPATNEGRRSRRVVGRSLRPALALLAVLALTAGCGVGQRAQTTISATATHGAEGKVGTMAVRDALLTAGPPVAGDTLHEPGADVPVQVTIVNEATGAVLDSDSDRLVAVSSPVFVSARITGDTRVPEGHVLTAGYRGPVSSVAPADTRRIGITLLGARTPLRAGLTYPVTFTFERAGALTLPLPPANPDVLPPRAGGSPRATR